jgi:hypothetical protein
MVVKNSKGRFSATRYVAANNEEFATNTSFSLVFFTAILVDRDEN